MKPATKPFKLNLLGLVRIESEGTVREIILILSIGMLFIVALMLLLTPYAIPISHAVGMLLKCGKSAGVAPVDH